MDSSLDWSKLKQLNVMQILAAFFIPSGFAFFGFSSRSILPTMVTPLGANFLVNALGIPVLVSG